MLAIGTTVLGVEDVARASRFWEAALGYVPRELGDDTWVVLVPTGDPGASLALMLSETAPQEHPRVHLDLYADDPAPRSIASWAWGPNGWTGICTRPPPTSWSSPTRTATGSA